MLLYHTRQGPVVQDDGRYVLLPHGWDALINRDDLPAALPVLLKQGKPAAAPLPGDLLAPLATQEVWAAGVTYFRSRTARMEESQKAGASDFYDRVYHAQRPELFFKASPHRVAGPGMGVRIRSDSKWNVPEPELALVVTASGAIIGYTIGNDMSSRDIEGENPLYLPQAKVYDRSCALGPCVLVSAQTPPPETTIHLQITRGGKPAFTGSTQLAQLKKTPRELVDYLYRDNSFPTGCILLTGTGVVPGNDFTLAASDEVAITIDGIGKLVNVVEGRSAK